MLLKKGKIDYWLFLIVLILLGCGLVAVLSSSQYYAQTFYGDSFYYFKKQLLNASIGILAMIIFMQIPYRLLRRFANIAIIVCMGLLLLVAFSSLGAAAGGGLQWLRLGVLNFQPSELMKIALVLYFAKFMSNKKKEELHSFKDGFLPCITVLGIGFVLVATEDLGTGVVIGASIYLLMFCGGIRFSHLFSIILMGLAGIAALIYVAPYRLTRITILFDPYVDPLGDGYQIIQSLLAIGSGGLTGVGLGDGGAKWGYLPERHTDFIYSVWCEELGFIGAMFLVIMFALFIWRGLKIALEAQDKFGALLATGLTLMIGLQAIINIGITVGLLPVTGITLPFISYGGSSLVVTLMSVGILLNISKHQGVKRQI